MTEVQLRQQAIQWLYEQLRWQRMLPFVIRSGKWVRRSYWDGCYVMAELCDQQLVVTTRVWSLPQGGSELVRVSLFEPGSLERVLELLASPREVLLAELEQKKSSLL